MWKITVEPDGPQTTVFTWRMHSVCLTNTATDAHSECVILTANPRQQWLGEHAPLLRYMYTACLVSIFAILN